MGEGWAQDKCKLSCHHRQGTQVDSCRFSGPLGNLARPAWLGWPALRLIWSDLWVPGARAVLFRTGSKSGLAWRGRFGRPGLPGHAAMVFRYSFFVVLEGGVTFLRSAWQFGQAGLSRLARFEFNME